MKIGEQWQINAGERRDHYATNFSGRAACSGRRGPDCGANPAGAVSPSVDARAFGRRPQHLRQFRDVASITRWPYTDLEQLGQQRRQSQLRSAKTRTTEFGTKWDLLDERVLLTDTLYRTEVTNELVQDPTDGACSQIGKKRVQGIEISALGKLTYDWGYQRGLHHDECQGHRWQHGIQ